MCTNLGADAAIIQVFHIAVDLLVPCDETADEKELPSPMLFIDMVEFVKERFA
jgi:hypothetical protein